MLLSDHWPMQFFLRLGKIKRCSKNLSKKSVMGKRETEKNRFIWDDSKRSVRVVSSHSLTHLLACRKFKCMLFFSGWLRERERDDAVCCALAYTETGLGQHAMMCLWWILVQVHRIFSYFNSFEGESFICCFLNSFSCYGMRVSYYIIIYISALKT